MGNCKIIAGIIVFLFGLISMKAQENDSILADYFQKAQFRQAIEYIETQAPVRDLLYKKALCYKSLNNYSQAIRILEILHENDPDDIPVLLELAQAYEVRLQFSKGIRCYENLITIDSGNIFFQVRKADLLYRSEKYETALDNYLRIDPEKYNAAYLKKSIALCYEKLNQPDSAKWYYAESCKNDPSDIFPALSLVKIYIQEKNYLQALQYSEAFIANDSTNAQMNALNAFAYYNLNVYEEAVKRFEKCRAAGDSSLMINRSLGFSYYLLQNDTAAYPCLQRAYIQDTTNINLLYALASVNYNLGDYPQAIQNYQILIVRTMPDKNALYTYFTGLAQSYEKNRIFTEAVQNYTTANSYASTNQQKMVNFFALAVLMEFDLKDYNQAVFYYTQYRAALANYEDALSEEENPDIQKLKEIQLKINELNKHINELKIKYKINYTDKIWSN
jgi:tetratricopeptide (TPR) repeat protein